MIKPLVNNKVLYYYLFFFCFLFNSILFSNDTTDLLKLNLSTYNNIEYINLSDFLSQHKLKSNYYEAKDKIEIIYEKTKIYFSPSISYCKINDKIYHLTHPIIYLNQQYYLPAIEFYNALELAGLPIRVISQKKNTLYVNSNIYNLSKLVISNKQNGTLVKLKTTQLFKKQDVSFSISSSNWLNITVLNCYLDTLAFNQTILENPISKIKTLQSAESAQISLLLNTEVENIDLDIQPNEINLLLQNSIAENANKIKEMRSKWLIDTIVLDPGHGGKDPGAIGHGQQEKDITLDIAKKLGKLIKRNLGLNVVYTREEDDFVPLWKRTKIANDVGGKLFISIHVNATARSASTKGYETFFLRPGKTDSAIEVVERENSVIDLEQGDYEYIDLTNENYIVASMAQNTFMKESEDLAALIQQHLQTTLKTKTKNRGVKQAGFYVLVGATMPNVLVEVGFISNKQEAKSLSKSYYRRQLAEAIFNAIVDFKIKYEKPLLNNE